jgi:hypothetical protein
MPILNYTTKVPAAKTVAEIQSVLGSKGATHVSIDYRDGKPMAVEFGLKLQQSILHFRLPHREGLGGSANGAGRSRPG